MQSYTEIADDKTIEESRALLLANDKSIMSCNSGTAFPTTNLQHGMLCYRTNLPSASGGLYELVNEALDEWKLIRDFAKTPLHKEEADALYATVGHNHDASYSAVGHTHSDTYELVDANIVRKNVATAFTKPQRPQARQTLTGQSGTVTLDIANYNDFRITQSAAIALANPVITSAEYDQRGRIRIVGNAYGITALGTAWKRVGGTGIPTMPTAGYLRIDYEITEDGTVEFTANGVEA